jgi:glycosyltransferase involved in cell wall biosynthesis
MRIVQFLASKGWGGLENMFVNLCNELSKTTKVDVIILKNSACIGKFNGNIKLHTLKSTPSRYNLLLYFEFYWLLKKIEPCLIQTHAVKATQIFFIINKMTRLPHVATKHNGRKGKIFNSLPHVIAVSQGVKESIKNKNVKIIFNGIKPITLLSQERSKLFTLLAVGRLDKIKGYDILIHECSKLNFQFQLHIIGEGEEKKNLEELIIKLDLIKQVKLLGFREDIPQLMKNSDVVVMSSHSEGFSLVMLESLFYANLLLSTKVSGATEILEDEFLFDEFNIAEHLIKVYENYNYYKDNFHILSNNIQGSFLLEHVSKEYATLYKTILGGESK